MNYLYAKVDRDYNVSFWVTRNKDVKILMDSLAVNTLEEVKSRGNKEWKAEIQEEIELIKQYQIEEVTV